MGHCRLMWLVVLNHFLPESMSVFRRHRCTGDGTRDLASPLEEARRMVTRVHVAFLDIHGRLMPFPTRLLHAWKHLSVTGFPVSKLPKL